MLEFSMVSLVVFIAAYVLFIFLPHKRTLVSVAAAFVIVLSGCISLREAVAAINWNVMGIFVGTLVLADIFMESRVPAYLAEIIVDKAKSTCWAILFICMMTGFISAFVENVASVLIVAPIAMALAQKLKINPVNMMLGIAVSSNLQGAATLIGDPPSMLLGGYARMTFMDFFFFKGKPSIFFGVELGALMSVFVLYFFFRQHREKTESVAIEKVQSWFPTILLVSLIIMLALSSFFDKGFSYLAGIICMGFGAVATLWEKLINKGSIVEGLKKLDWDTTAFLMAVFILVGSLTITGWIDRIALSLSNIFGGNTFMGYTAIVFISILVSAFVDNVPYLAAMLPVAVSLSAKMGIDPTLFLFGLLIGASIGGNITPIGASANIVACSILKKEGYHVSFWEFAKIGLPFTLTAVIPAYLFFWFIWN
ncbi:MAG TPA: SLC13 family permease [bacterium]|nr:SLC13 family permease [bacterium]